MKRREWIALSGVVLAAIAAWLFAHRDVPWVFWTGDEAEYAEVARRLAAGRGFTTGIIYPIEIEWGVDAEHPSLLRAPLWPIGLAAVFSLTGPREVSVLVATLVCHAVTAGLVFTLGASLAGLRVALVAGLAAAISPDLVASAQYGTSETFFGLWVALFFVLLARRADGFWIGAVCGLAYLTRYNGGLLFVAGLLTLLRRPFEPAPLLRCAAGFGLVVAPWLVRNIVVTGSPVYSLYDVTLYFTAALQPLDTSLIYMIEPDLTSAAAMSPLDKVPLLLPDAILHWPLATANLIACIGLLLGCVRRDRSSLALFGVAAATTLVITTMALRGRYLIPFVPAMIAIGSAAWLRFGGRLAAPALVLVLVAPLLTSFPSPLYDVQLTREFGAQIRAKLRTGEDPSSGVAAQFATCLADRPLVIAQNGAAVNWAADTVTLHMTRTDEDFWRLVGDYPVEYVLLRAKHRLRETPAFLERFVETPQCGEGVYRRR